MDAVPIVPPLFRGTKNTTLHELQTHDRSRATDTGEIALGERYPMEYSAAGSEPNCRHFSVRRADHDLHNFRGHSHQPLSQGAVQDVGGGAVDGLRRGPAPIRRKEI